jgi:uncharacterized SAM-binding protein YcdF (DUF218 family)
MEEHAKSEGRWHRIPKWTRVLLVLAALFFLGWHQRTAILRGLGDHLVTEGPLAHADAVYVLGGSAKDRGREAARLYAQGFSERFVFTGAPVNTNLEALGIDSTEAECTRHIAVREGIPLRLTTALNKGTSTIEESNALLAQAIADGSDTVMVVSNRFHLRRVRFVFRERFRKAGITVLLHGAPSTQFDERTWWASEEGLIMLNNEYVKLAYYHLKY